MDLWMQIALGALALTALVLFGPRLGSALRDSPKGTAQDWLGLMLPLGGVVLFVSVLIWLAQRA